MREHGGLACCYALGYEQTLVWLLRACGLEAGRQAVLACLGGTHPLRLMRALEEAYPGVCPFDLLRPGDCEKLGLVVLQPPLEQQQQQQEGQREGMLQLPLEQQQQQQEGQREGVLQPPLEQQQQQQMEGMLQVRVAGAVVGNGDRGYQLRSAAAKLLLSQLVPLSTGCELLRAWGLIQHWMDRV